MKLIIVESPTKAKTIAKFLGDDYTITSSYGHVRDLPKGSLGIDLAADFAPKYVIPLKARPVVKTLKALVKDADTIVLATDEDREGEAIAWHLVQALGLGESQDGSTELTANQKSKTKKLGRIVFHEITKPAILAALEHPRMIDDHLVDAQQARRILDRLVGYKLSPFLWKKVAKGLSAGRVQSAVVRLIVEREQEIRQFKPQEYWTITATLLTSTHGALDADLASIDGVPLEKFTLNTKDTTDELVRELQDSTFQIAAIETKTIKKNPPAPFITSTLQQEAAKRLGFSSKKTMLFAQRLYENGLITYMRTDSVNLATSALASAKAHLETHFGAPYAAEAPRTYHTSDKSAQEAHEAIRPTDVNVTPTLANLKEVAEQKLYSLIWQRFLASQMPQAIFDATQIQIRANAKTSGRNFMLHMNGNMLRFDGFLKVWSQKFEERELPKLSTTTTLTPTNILPAQHFTEPPARYSEASLIKTLEKFGIGRPSTYAPTISVIQTRNYVTKDRGRFSPTEIGELVNGVLTEHFNEVVDIGFTAKMENSLDAVAEGRERWQDLLHSFYDPFGKKLEEKYAEVAKINTTEPTNEICDKCSKPMVIKFGRFGKFIACSGFPDCKNTKQLAKEAPKMIGMKCPDCKDGDVVERRVSRGRARGKIFWGCSTYPTCKYATWENPVKPV